MEEFRYLTRKEIDMIRKDELEIFSLLRQRHVFLDDENGDAIPHEDTYYLIDTTIVVEPQTLQIPESNIFSSLVNGREINDLIDYEVWLGYHDVYSIDRSIASHVSSYAIDALGYFIEGMYQGHVWCFRYTHIPEYLGLYGIRSSLVNSLTKKRGIARKIISHIMNSTIDSNTSIVVPWPLHPMPHLLVKLGFVEVNEPCTTVRDFLCEISSTSNYYIYKR